MLQPSEGMALSVPTDFASDVAEYLQRTPRQLPSRYFYDALGSALFDAICRLPWYRVTRAETALLARHARQMLERLPRPLNITELGCGNGEKLAVLLEKGGERFRRAHLIDISPAALLSARARLATLPGMPVTTFQGHVRTGVVPAGGPSRPRRVAGAVPRVEHRQLRSTGSARDARAGSARRSSRATPCCSERIWSNLPARCRWPTTTRCR